MAEEPEQARAPQERPLWNLNRDEQRTLMVTFVGGLGSILAGAAILGLALAMARTEHGKPHQTSDWVEIGIFTAAFAAAIPATIKFRAFASRRQPEFMATPFMKVLVPSMVAVASFGLAIGLLGLIGLAAGIK